MSSKSYPEEFKIEAVKEVIDRGHSNANVATRLDITTHSLFACTALIHQPLKCSLIPSLRSGDFRKNRSGFDLLTTS